MVGYSFTAYFQTLQGLSRKYPAILNISRTSQVALM